MTSAGWNFSSLGMLIIVALMVAAIFSVVSTLRGSSGAAASAREILARRLASGELTLAQHAEITQRTPGDRGAPSARVATSTRPAGGDQPRSV
ncbi:MAG: hypothetical protein ACR2KV_17600 [Solirubrobacteraceae bacterium]